MSEGKTHYEVLGLAQDASPDEIKRRFRELALKYHPDRNRDRPEFHELFIRINGAYEVLNDPNRRAAYDLNLRDEARRAAARKATAPPPPPGRPGPARPNGAHARPGGPMNGAPPGPVGAATQREREKLRLELHRLLEDAKLSYARGHLREAQRTCEDILRIARVGAAHDILGDIAMRQGRVDEAVEHYTVAAQMSRHPGMILSKLNRAVAIRSGAGTGMHAPPAGSRGPLAPAARNGYRMAALAFGFSLILFLMLWGHSVDRTALGWPLVPHWTLSHLCVLGLDGLLAGLALAAGIWIRPFDEELFYSSLGPRGRGVPLGLLLGFLAALSMPLALLVYIGSAAFQGAVSRSLITVFAVASALTFAFTFFSPSDAQTETLLFGGNVLFLGMLVGWFIGDLFRPSWAL